MSERAGATTPLSDAMVRRLQHSVDAPALDERFEVHELLGRGGMGRVYRVTDRLLQRDVALKVLALDADSPALGRRLAREARVLAQLEHPGIAAIHDAGVLDDGRPFYLMRLVRGRSLAESVPGGAPGERLRLFLRIGDAVAFAHARGVVHRDLKPGNVMLGAYGDVVVVDWGVAKLLQRDDAMDAALPSGVDSVRGHDALADVTREGDVLGTPGYMAPEQAGGRAHAVDARADVYGLGVLLRHLLQAAPSNAEAAPVPRPLAAIVSRATEADPSSRYPDVETMSADVRHWLDAEPVSAYRESVVERALRVYARNRALLLLLLAYAVVRVVILVWRGV